MRRLLITVALAFVFIEARGTIINRKDTTIFSLNEVKAVNEYVDDSYVPKTMYVNTEAGAQATTAEELGEIVSSLHPSSENGPVMRTMGIPQRPRDMSESRVLVLYTGGTIGMKSVDGVYQPVPHYLLEAVRDLPPLNDKAYVVANYANATVKPYALPPVRHMNKRVVYWIVEYQPLLDSSDMTFDDWIRIGRDIRTAYALYDGFVVLHGTDTMAYTSSVLSFMFENLRKPVIVTGAQIPICEVRSDGRDNFIASLIIAGNINIPEVTLYFDNKLIRGNRAVKIDNFGLNAFESPNLQPLARLKIDIEVNWSLVLRTVTIAPFSLHDNLCRYVGALRIFPSIPINVVRAFLQPPTLGVVLETYGAGNMPSRRTDIIDEIKAAVKRGCIVINVSQCVKGEVEVAYLTGQVLYDAGAIPGADITPEAALVKLAYVLGKAQWDLDTKREMIAANLRGEITLNGQ